MVDFWQDKRILITGGSGFVGQHLIAKLRDMERKLVTPSSARFDLRKVQDVEEMFKIAGNIDVLFNLAANVGGIGYNQNHPYSLYYDNILINTNVIDAAIRHKVKKFVQLGTVCAYPKFTPVPFDERALWDGYPEETNAPYGLAKRVSLVQLQAARQEFGFNGIYVLPTNLYGPGDNFNPEQSHVIPALIKKFVEAKDEIEIWGTGNASRDFLHVQDAIDGLLLLAEKYDGPEPVNLGNGQEIRITALVEMIRTLTGFCGKIKYNEGKPDGQPRRVLRTWKAKDLGWQPKIELKEGLRETIEYYKTIA